MPEPDTLPLVVDLDGTLCTSDLLYESFCVLLKHRPWCLLLLPSWLTKGKAYLKQQIAQRVSVNVRVLPYHTAFLDYLRSQYIHGRHLVLATATDQRLAQDVAEYLRIFHMVLASDGTTNLSAERKRDRLVALFGIHGFDYAGNAPPDLHIWAVAHQAIVVNASQQVQAAVSQNTEVSQVFDPPPGRMGSLARALHLLHWIKNLLIFTPLLVTLRVQEGSLLWQAGLACIAFGLCASSAYVLNDLLDLAADRQHPDKRKRPFAAGALPLLVGLIMIPLLLGLSGLVSLLLPSAFFAMLMLYYAATLVYSFVLQQVVPLNVLLLAGLYTVRIAAGSAATATWLSGRVMAVSTCLFLGLVLVQRNARPGIQP